jgi:hypothetical protein
MSYDEAEVLVTPGDARTPFVAAARARTPAALAAAALAPLVSHHAFVLPVVIVSKSTFDANVKEVTRPLLVNADVATLTVSRSLLTAFADAADVPEHLVKYRYGMRFLRPLGTANAPKWDGTHEGVPVFRPR